MPGMTVTFPERLMTSAPAGGAPSFTLAILFPRTTMVTLSRGWAEVPSIKVAAWMAMVFSGAGGWGFWARLAESKMAQRKSRVAVRRNTLRLLLFAEANMNTPL